MNNIAPIGHNSGESSPFEALKARTSDFISGIGNFEEKFANGIESQEDADNAADFRKQINAHLRACDKQRKADKQPHLEAGKKVDADYKTITDILKVGMQKIDAPILDFANKQEAIRQEKLRIERDAAARKEAEAKAALEKAQESENLADKQAANQKLKAANDALKNADALEKNKTALGQRSVNGRSSKVRMVETKSAKVIDSEKAAAQFHSHPDVIAAIEKAATSLMKSQPDFDFEKHGIEQVITQSLR